MTSHHHSNKMTALHLISAHNESPALISIKVGEKIEQDIRILLPNEIGNYGHYLQANGEWDEFYIPIELTTLPGHNKIKHHHLDKQMVTFVKAIVEINNSIAILYCTSLGQLMLIKNDVEYLIANDSNTDWATILVGSTGNLLIGHVSKGNLYHHYYLKGKFYEVPIDMTNNNEKFISHIMPNGYPCYLYTRYTPNNDEVTLSYCEDVNGQHEWFTSIINTRPSFTSEYFRSYSLLNTYDGVMYMAESCKDKYFSISSCDDITKNTWKNDIIYDSGYYDYNIHNDGNNFIVQNMVYNFDNLWKPIPFELDVVGILDMLPNVVLTTDGYLYRNGLSTKLSDNIIFGSLILLPNGQILVLIVSDIDQINIYRVNG